MKNEIIGRWRIARMDQWDLDYIDMVEEGNITFTENGLGSFIFGVVSAQIDWRLGTESEKIEFTWEGSDEGDPVCGRGWAAVKEGGLTGKLYFHLGDESSFEATKAKLRSSRRSQ